jgi:pilus assembly protein CpaB
MVRPVNPRQRRAVLLLVLSGLGMVAVFALVASYVSGVRSEVDPKVQLLALDRDAPADEAITDDMVRAVAVPARYAPATALRDRAQIVGLVAGAHLTRGSILQQGMLVQPPQLAPGQRELAILVDAETGVAGQISPGAIVDNVASFEGNDRGQKADSEVVVPAARILAVGQTRAKGGQSVDQAQAADPQQVVPVTFALTADEALKVTYAESFAQEVRLSLRRPGDREPLGADETMFVRKASGT